jgi:hypothetical protein
VLKPLIAALLLCLCLGAAAHDEPRDPPEPGKVIALVVMYILNGELEMKALKAPTMQQCMWALPEVAKLFPDTASLACVSLRDETNT